MRRCNPCVLIGSDVLLGGERRQGAFKRETLKTHWHIKRNPMQPSLNDRCICSVMCHAGEIYSSLESLHQTISHCNVGPYPTLISCDSSSPSRNIKIIVRSVELKEENMVNAVLKNSGKFSQWPPRFLSIGDNNKFFCALNPTNDPELFAPGNNNNNS